MMAEQYNYSNMLPVGTVLHDTYRIDRYLASGGFGNTYVATNLQFDETVAIKEFFMRDISYRDADSMTVSVSSTDARATFQSQLEKFKKEARRLRKLHNPHIVQVHDLFDEYGTAYYVMDYIDGLSLRDRLKQQGQPMAEQEVLGSILPQILDALEEVHSLGIYHLDLKPANIMLSKDGTVELIDFGASKQQSSSGGVTTSSALSYTNGYAPREQMEQMPDKFGPWTDLYALGATLYTLLTDRKPPMPSDIDEDQTPDKHESLPMPSSVSAKTRHLVLWLMATNRKQRPQSVEEVRNSLEEDDTVLDEKPKVDKPRPKPNPASQPEPKTKVTHVEPSPKPEKAKPILIGVAAIVAAIVLVLIGISIGGQSGSGDQLAATDTMSVDTSAVIATINNSPEVAVSTPSANETQSATAPQLERPTHVSTESQSQNTISRSEQLSNQSATASQPERPTHVSTESQSQNTTSRSEQRSNTNNAVITNLINNMVYVEGGTFTMGATSEQGSDAKSDEKPAHQVTLSSFSIGKYEVTQREWVAIMGRNPSNHKGDDLPVEEISWDDCQEFINKLNSLTGRKFRLPTEAEWEYAARGGQKSCGYKYAGSNNIDEVAWYGDNSSNQTHRVGTKKPNELGLYDMSGNVWERCNDWYGAYSSLPQSNPKGPISGSYRVFRGCSYTTDPLLFIRLSVRAGIWMGRRSDIGFRLAI